MKTAENLYGNMIIPMDNGNRILVIDTNLYLPPSGGGYVPQVLFPLSGLFEKYYLPESINVSRPKVLRLIDALRKLGEDTFTRYVQAFYPGSIVFHKIGHAQGEVYLGVVFHDPEWLAGLGLSNDPFNPAPSDAYDLMQYVLGNVWEALHQEPVTWTNAKGETKTEWSRYTQEYVYGTTTDNLTIP